MAIIVTMPSAGATISPSPFGVVRIGSRKKAATQRVSPAKIQPSQSQSTTTQKKSGDGGGDDDELAAFRMDAGHAVADVGGDQVRLFEGSHGARL